MPRRRDNGEGTLRKKGKKWQCQIRVGGKQRTVTRDTKKEASLAGKALKRWLEWGIDLDAYESSFSDYLGLDNDDGALRRYCDHKETTRGTFKNYESFLKQVIKILGDELRLCDLRPEHLNRLNDEPAKSSNHRSNRYKAFKMIFDFARKEGIVPKEHDPFSNTLAPRSRSKKDRVQRAAKSQAYFSEDNLGRLFKAVQGGRIDVWTESQSCTGARPGESAVLEWDDINWSRGRIHIHKSGRFSNGGLEITDGKTDGSERYIDVPTELMESLDRHLNQQFDIKRERGSYWVENNLVFPTTIGTHWDIKNLREREWRTALAKTGYTDEAGNWVPPLDHRVYGLYALRHTFASMQIADGVDDFTLKERMGHASVEFTKDVYGHLFDNAQEQAREAMGARMRAVRARNS